MSADTSARPAAVHTIFAGQALPRGAGAGKNWDEVRSYIEGLEKDAARLREVRAVLLQWMDVLEAHTGASHLMDGFSPRRNSYDDLLRTTKALLVIGE